MPLTEPLGGLSAEIDSLSCIRPVGRIERVDAGVVHVSGIAKSARIGDWITIQRSRAPLAGEIVQLQGDVVIALPDAAPDGVALQDRVVLSQAGDVATTDAWIGRVIDASGKPLDGKPLLRGATVRALTAAPPAAADRRPLGPRLETGMAALSTLLPVVRGQRVGLFAGSGVGKSSLLGHLGQHLEADVVVIALIGAVVLYVTSLIFPALQTYPKDWVYDPSAPLNTAIDYVIIEYASWIALIKQWAFFYLMLPFKMGLEQVISPFSWGFQFTTPLKLGYGAVALGLVLLAWLRGRQRGAVVIGLLAIVLFFGLTRMPWPAIWLIMAYVAWQLSGLRLMLVVLAGLAYLLLSGIWPQTLLSVYLCGIGVILSFALGSTLGILASEFDPVSRFLRPINDTLQTMPLFVLLIPFVMIFKIGEFTALLAVMAYAIVPAIRYSEHGLRNVPHDVIEAAECMGCTRWQLLWRVKIPLAIPEMMLGLNQTIMFGISMLVIAALVGTSGLGQQVYIGLGDGDFGVGMTAGIGMAIIAIMADRLTAAWSAKLQERYTAS